MSSALWSLVPLLGVPLLWLAGAILAWGGVVRHSYRIYRAQQERDAIRRAGENGWLRWAANSHLMEERFRWSVKLVLLEFALVRGSVIWDRLERLAPAWDWRDYVQPLLYLLVLLLLTHWSNWEAAYRPRRTARESGAC